MKAIYIVALLMIVLMVGCTTTQPEAAPAAPVETAPEAPPAQVEAPLETEPAEAEVELSDAEMDRIDSLKAACERGALAVCLSLKNVHGIDWSPAEVAEEPVVEEPVEEPPEAVEVPLE
jgi:PBP1b-binding outer membrane lipoprotein LpoB